MAYEAVLTIKITADLTDQGFGAVEACATVNFCPYAQVDSKYFQSAD